MQYTIEELADSSKQTVRNIRAYQSRGLLSSPHMKGRVGYYDGKHLAQLDLIIQLQNEGFNLAAIKKVSESAFGADALWVDVSPNLLASLENRPESAQMFLDSGLMRHGPDGQYQGLLAHRLLTWELVDAGVEFDLVVQLVQRAIAAGAESAAHYGNLIREVVDKAAVASDAHPEELRAAAVQLMTAMFGAAITHQSRPLDGSAHEDSANLDH